MFSAASSAASTPRTPALAAGGSKTSGARQPPTAAFRVVHNPAFSAEVGPSPKSGRGEPSGESPGKASFESVAALGRPQHSAAEPSNGARREGAATADKVEVPSWSESRGPAPAKRQQQPSRLASGGGSGPLTQQLPRLADSSSNGASQEAQQLSEPANGSSSGGVDEKQEIAPLGERLLIGTAAVSSDDSHTSQGERPERKFGARIVDLAGPLRSLSHVGTSLFEDQV